MAMMLSMMYVKHVLEPTAVTDSHLIVKIVIVIVIKIIKAKGFLPRFWGFHFLS
jgi:hypothetical protein